MSETATEDQTIVRDVRIDRIGFVQELVKQFSDPLKDDVKKNLTDKGEQRAEGDFFDAVMASYTPSVIDPAKWFKRYEAGKLSKQQFLECLSVNKKKAEEHLSGAEMAKMSDSGAPVMSLSVRRKKGVEIVLVDAVKSVSDAISRRED